jgi:hypothetical protein
MSASSQTSTATERRASVYETFDEYMLKATPHNDHKQVGDKEAFAVFAPDITADFNHAFILYKSGEFDRVDLDNHECDSTRTADEDCEHHEVINNAKQMP